MALLQVCKSSTTFDILTSRFHALPIIFGKSLHYLCLMLWLRRAYIMYGALVFVGSFIILFPLFWLCIQVKPLRPLSMWVNQIWCWIFFPAILMPIITQDARKNIPKGPVVFVANHTSYLDIAMLTWVIRRFVAFVGKASLLKVPLFGYYFKHLHISVDRRNAQDRNKALEDAIRALREGRSVVFFPEGRISLDTMPQVGTFRDGAFRAAIACQVPVVPISIAYNWYIMPDWGKDGARWHWAHFQFHQPLFTTGLQEGKDVELLRETAYNIIQTAVASRNPKVLANKQAGKPYKDMWPA